jgi:hypothetical protein
VAAKGGRNDDLCFYHSRFGNKAHKCEKGCTRKTNRLAVGPQFAAAAGPIPACRPPSVAIPELVTAMSAFPTKNLIFLKDSKSNLNFLVDSGASISILPHSSLAPPTWWARTETLFPFGATAARSFLSSAMIFNLIFSLQQ